MVIVFKITSVNVFKKTNFRLRKPPKFSARGFHGYIL